MKKIFVDHFNHKTLSITDALGVLQEYERLISYIYAETSLSDVALTIEESVDFMGKMYKTYNGKIVVKE